MAKRRRRKLNKSQAIRDYLATHPSAAPNVIQEAMAARGLKVSASLISQVKYKPGSAKRRRKRRAMAGRPAARRPQAVDVEMLVAAKAIADKLGGVARAKEALTLLERLR